jgi:hypothetical protein
VSQVVSNIAGFKSTPSQSAPQSLRVKSDTSPTAPLFNCVAIAATAVEAVRQVYMEQVPRTNPGINFVAPSWGQLDDTIKAASALCPCTKLVFGGYETNLHLIWLLAAKITY